VPICCWSHCIELESLALNWARSWPLDWEKMTVTVSPGGVCSSMERRCGVKRGCS